MRVAKFMCGLFAFFFAVLASIALTGCDDLFVFDIKKVEPSIYRVIVLSTQKDEKNQSVYQPVTGTAFHVSGVSTVITADHVVENVARDEIGPLIYVGFLDTTSSQGEPKPKWVRAKVIATRPDKDIAVLKAEERLPGAPLSLADFGEIPLRDGDAVKAIGFPGGADFDLNKNVEHEEIYRQFASVPSLLNPTKTDGSISRIFNMANAVHIQHQAPISPGMSGGPLFDECGVVIGINQFKSTSAEYIGAAIYAKELVDILELEELKPSKHTTPCNAQNYKRMMPFAVGGIGILLSTMAIVFALRRPALRDRMTRMTRSMQAPRRTGLQPPRSVPGGSEMFASPARSQSARSTEANFRGSIQLIPSAGSQPITIGEDQLSGEGVVVGRQADCGVVIENETVSKHHARLRLRDDGNLLVEDLGSGNGTWHGKERIKCAVVKNGETVRFGSLSFRFARTATIANGKPDGTALGAMNTKIGRPELCWMLSGFDESGKVVQFTLEAHADPTTGKPGKASWTIGRKPERVDHVLLDRSVSSEHAQIRYVPGRGLEISDLGSANGTKIDGTAVSSKFASLEGVRNVEFGRFKMTLNRA